MILLTLTTEGGDREDGNVFYAQHIVIHAPRSCMETALKIVQKELGGTIDMDIDHAHLVVQMDEDDAFDKFQDAEGLAVALSKAGLTSEVPAQAMVIGDKE